MNPDTQLILDELSRRFSEHDSKWDRRVAEQESRWNATFSEFTTGQDRCVGALEQATGVLEDWRMNMEGMMDDLRLEVGKISKNWERAVVDNSSAMAGILAPSPPAVEQQPAGVPANRPHGHRVESSHREDGFGSVTTLLHTPVKGMCSSLPRSPAVHTSEFHQHVGDLSYPTMGGAMRGRLPKLNFPVFDGENPKLWIRRSHDYFDMYEVEPHLWIRVASMHFVGGAARWFSSLDEHSHLSSWPVFCRVLLERFGKDEHELFIRQLFRIRQHGTVTEYVDQFSSLVDKLVSYGRPVDPLYFVQRFVDGLRSDIRAAIILQRPSSLDSACALALLQEEVATSDRRLEHRRPEWASSGKGYGKSSVPPFLTARPDKTGAVIEETKPAEQHRARVLDDKLAALRAYRRAKGLCQRCAEKWSRDHKCPPTVQLHALQELWELYEGDEDTIPEDVVVEDQIIETECLAISIAAVKGLELNHTLKLRGLIQGIEVVMLIDSGSSHSFIASRVASRLSGVTDMAKSVLVQVADGNRLKCSCQLVGARWSVQHCVFDTDLRVLDLASYDMIIGMDWLAANSPMKVHWSQKWMIIPYQRSWVLLHGLSAVFPPGSIVELDMIESEPPLFAHLDLTPVLMALLEEFKAVFAPPNGLPPTRECDHTIPLVPGAVPVHVRPYRYPPAIKDEIERQVSVMLQSGIIQPSTSPFSSSVLLVKKKDNSWRFCVDFRHLNAITVKTSFPVPVIEELLDELGQASWFTSLDLTAGYHQIRLLPADCHKTAFQTHSGHYEFRVMAFGLTGAPATFQRAMNATLAPLLRRCVLVFFDDILIYSSSFEDHIQHVRAVFELLIQYQWQIKLNKCSFARPQLSYLGHVISAAGVATDPSKIQAVSQWSSPRTVKELRSFLGLAGYYRRFVRHFGLLARPLTGLLKKGAIFVWTPAHEASFAALKQALVSAPVLALPNFSLPFCLETDASNHGVGAVLLQSGHPIAYLSKALGPRSQGLSTYEKEFLAILIAVDHWRHYLQLKEFIIYTDHRSLAQLDEQRLHTPWQKKMFTRLLGLQYRIVYKKGVENGVADALSRHPIVSASCLAVSSCQPQWVTEVADTYLADTHSSDIIAKLAVDSSAVPHFSWQDGLLRYKKRIWVGPSAHLHQKLIAAFHTSAVGGHSGFPVTYARLKQLFAWQGLKTEVHTYVTHCLICQQAKADRARLPGLLQPLPVPSSLWQIISMDFIEALPSSHSYTCILVVVDLFSKYANFLPLKHPFTALTVARLFHDQVYKHHGLPHSIVSDRDKVFLSNLWKELFRLADVQLRMSSAYHPQSDGQTERVNQCLETFLRCFVHACPHQWSK
ncbi:uncharacterized protein [Zea mays]|uniref:uncharacterized protein isoform X1 n=1 Tax=Zea mays TaxID=4577 RepID=UPI001652455D|nr:uncharacterized protein LOC103653200 isoform X1 [Zea mays]